MSICGLPFLCTFTGYPRGPTLAIQTPYCPLLFCLLTPSCPRQTPSAFLRSHFTSTEQNSLRIYLLIWIIVLTAMPSGTSGAVILTKSSAAVCVCVLSEGIICYRCGFNGSTQNPAHCALRPDTNSQKQTTQEQQGNKEWKQDLKRLLAA